MRIGGLIVALGVVVVLAARFGPIVFAWRRTDDWSAVSNALQEQPEATSWGWLSPENCVIRYVVGPEPSDTIDLMPRDAHFAAHSDRAYEVLRRAALVAGGGTIPRGVVFERAR